MSCSALWYRTLYLRLGPIRSPKIVYDDVGEVLPMFILTTVDEKLGALPQASGMT